MAENIMIQNGGAGIGKPMGSPKFDDFLKNLPIEFLDPCKVPQLLRRKKAKSNSSFQSGNVLPLIWAFSRFFFISIFFANKTFF